MKLRKEIGEGDHSPILKNPKVSEVLKILGPSKWGKKTARFVAFHEGRIYFWWNDDNMNYGKFKGEVGYGNLTRPGKDIFTGVVSGMGNKLALTMSPTLNHFRMEIEDGIVGAIKNFSKFTKSFDRKWKWLEKYIVIFPFYLMWMNVTFEIAKKYADTEEEKAMLTKETKGAIVKPYSKEDIKKIVDKYRKDRRN